MVASPLRSLERWAGERAAAPAFIEGESRSSHGRLWEDASRAAEAQRAAGLGSGDRILLAGADHRSSLVWLVACMLAETVLVPVTGGEPSWEARVADRTGARARAGRDLTVATVPGAPEAPTAPPDLRAIVMTSGSTGSSKAVWIDDRMIEAAADTAAATLDFTPETVFLDFLPSHTVGHLFLAGLPVLAAGGAVAGARFHPRSFPETVAASRPTATILLPVMIRLLDVTGALERAELSGLTVGCGASPVPASAATRTLEAGAERFVHMYGLSEVLSPALARATDDPADPDVTLLNGPLGDLEARLGLDGELQLRGSAVTRGYDGDPEGTAAALADGWFSTGDQFERVGSAWAFRGRIDDIVKVNGWSVSPALTERAVMDVPGVRACAAGVAAHPVGGEILICLVEGEDVEAAAVVAACRARVDSHQVPSRVLAVEQVPVNAMGKVDRRAANAMIADRAGRKARRSLPTA